MISAIGISDRASPGPVASSPRLKLVQSDASSSGAWCAKTTASSSVMRFTEVWPVNVAADQGGVIGTFDGK